ncbi:MULTISPECIES: DUF2933 domain-containing protein [Paracoccaceae]|nr:MULTISPECIES: DUF2933 domain-containing protein [Paracoccaceae]
MNESETPVEKSSTMPVMKYAMWACCAVMLLPIAAFVMAGGLAGGLTSGLYVFAPLLLCVAAHLIMHRMMGKSCHDTKSERTDDVAIQVDQKVAAD